MTVKVQTFDQGKAINTRKNDALMRSGQTREDLITAIAATVLFNINAYRGAYNDLSFVDVMRRFGGFDAFINTAIGPQPATETDDYWMWVLKQDLKEDILLRVKDRLQPEFRNFYRHEECGTQWDNYWTATCDDECPSCGAAISPYKSADAETGEVECEQCGTPIDVENTVDDTFCSDTCAKRHWRM